MTTVVLFGAGVAIAVILALTVALFAGRQQALDAGRSLTTSLARAAVDSTSRLIQSVDVVLISVAELMQQRQVLGDEAITNALRQRMSFSPQFRQIIIVDSNGRVQFDTAGAPKETKLDIADLLNEHRGSVRPLVIGKPQPRRFLGGEAGGGQSYIPMSRSFHANRQEDDGLIIATVNPQYLQSIFSALETGEGGAVSLYRFDGMLLTGTDQAELPGTHYLDKEPFRSRLGETEFGNFSATGFRGERRIVSYRMTLNWPLVITVGINEETSLVSWQQEVNSLVLPVALAALIVLGLTWVLSRLILDRARNEEALLLSDMALSSVTDGVTITDALAQDNPLVYVNPAFQRITGYQHAEALGRNPRFLHMEDRGQEGLATIKRDLKGGGSATAILRNYRKDGSLFWNELTVTAVADATGRVIHYVGVQRNITQRIESEAQLRKSLEETALANANLARFSEILAHHLQEPVRSLVIFTQHLCKSLVDRLDEKDKNQFDYIVAAALRLKRLLRDVELYLSVGGLSAGNRMVSAEAALNEALWRLTDSLMETNGSVTASELPDVWLDQSRLSEIFFRLIENSLLYCPKDRAPEIRISATWDDSEAQICLDDNGAGIPAEYHERVFRVFERLEQGDNHEGTGIGLALVQRIVTLAGGSVRIETNKQGGVSVIIILQRKAATDANDQHESAE
ncbi:MAG: PAS domain S-box protein [Alphaproteobacteria bacterium]|nr:PAS domain S-box protein [Alphaproteobacteria bacterium]